MSARDEADSVLTAVSCCMTAAFIKAILLVQPLK